MNLWAIINFVVFVGLLWWLLRKPAAAFWAKRSAAVADTLRQSAESHGAAQERIRDLETRLAHIEGEIDGMKIKLHEEGASEKAQIISQARIEAQRIREEAVTIGQQEIQKARQQLRRDMVEAAMAMAQTEVVKKLDEPKQQQLLTDATARLERKLH